MLSRMRDVTKIQKSAEGRALDQIWFRRPETFEIQESRHSLNIGTTRESCDSGLPKHTRESNCQEPLTQIAPALHVLSLFYSTIHTF